MRTRSLLVPAASALILTIALLVATAPGASAQGWTAPATLSTCGPATAPKVAFAFKSPLQRVRDGAIVWLGLSPSCTDVGTGKTSIDIAALGSDDLPGAPSEFTAGKAADVGLLAPLSTTITARGKIVVIAGSSAVSTLGSPAGVFGEGYATGTVGSLKPVAGPADLVATATGVIGDSDIASVIVTARGQHFILLRAQRHHAYAFAARLGPDHRARPRHGLPRRHDRRLGPGRRDLGALGQQRRRARTKAAARPERLRAADRR